MFGLAIHFLTLLFEASLKDGKAWPFPKNQSRATYFSRSKGVKSTLCEFTELCVSVYVSFSIFHLSFIYFFLSVVIKVNCINFINKKEKNEKSKTMMKKVRKRTFAVKATFKHSRTHKMHANI